MTRRDQIAALASAGLSDFEIAARLGISKRRVRYLLSRMRRSGVPVPIAADRRPITVGDGRDDGLDGPAMPGPRREKDRRSRVVFRRDPMAPVSNSAALWGKGCLGKIHEDNEKRLANRMTARLACVDMLFRNPRR